MCPTITVGSLHERSTFCSFVQQPPQLQTSTTPTSEASKTKRKNKTDVHNLEITLRIPTFFRNYATFWNFLDWNFFTKGSPLQFFLMFCNTMDVKKSQRVPPFTFFGTVTLFKNLIKKIFRKFFHVSKGSPFNFLKIFCNQLEFHKARRVPLLNFEP